MAHPSAFALLLSCLLVPASAMSGPSTKEAEVNGFDCPMWSRLRRADRLYPWSNFRPSRLGTDQRRDCQEVSVRRLYPEIFWDWRLEG
jgi:hypothetical protein